MKTWNFFDNFSKNTPISSFMKVRPVAAKLFHTNRQTDGRTDRHDDDSSCFSQFFANSPKNWTLSKQSKNHKYNNNNKNNVIIIVVFCAVCLVDQAALSKCFFVTHYIPDAQVHLYGYNVRVHRWEGYLRMGYVQFCDDILMKMPR